MRLWRYRLSTNFWDLIAVFFAAMDKFREIHDAYEAKVLYYADQHGVDRRLLRLSAEEVAGLLDFRKLEQLRDEHLSALKMVSHNIFRSQDTTDPFDRLVSQIFHELSILKEEQYKVATFAPVYRQEADERSYQMILDEVHEAFPRAVHGIEALFRRAHKRLEELLPHFAADRPTLRSVYLFGDEVAGEFYPDGYEDLLELMFPEGGAMRGLLEVARSFQASGFIDSAIEALERALELPPPLQANQAAIFGELRAKAEAALNELKESQQGRRRQKKTA
ncbi:MAG: hypothetical protein KatS3mg102_2787 [Planctomycetota bacterium]|nr:MAG: hypothetical protein KatS3mg102_2787 [Planctomycetota bacterium]